MSTHDDRILFFTHVQKAGGTTVEAVMRRRFGIRHMVVAPRRGWIYDETDLRADLRLNPWAKNVCSHWLRPFVSFPRYEARLVWYTILRDPIERYLSHYQHHTEKMGSERSFEDFLRDPIQRNWQTQLLAGEQDVEAAKQILASRFRCVGLLERFHESLLLYRDSLGIPGLRVDYGRPRNTAVSGDRRRALRSASAAHADACAENNRLDIELYEFAVREIFPRQVEAYGAERLQRDLAAEFAPAEATVGETLREISSSAFRRLVYLPVSRFRTAVANARGVPDVRR